MSAFGTLDSRYSFVAQFLCGAARFAELARDIERGSSASVSEQAQTDHRAYVAAAIMQSSAALEAEIAEVSSHGPGHHLGSNGVDATARDFLGPIADVIDDRPTLERYQLVLHLLQKNPFDRGAPPFQSAALLVRLRNELVHYKSKSGADMQRVTLFESLRKLELREAPFAAGNYFPQRCLGADCAIWSVRAAMDFIDAFYERLGVPCHLDAHRSRILASLDGGNAAPDCS